MTDLVQRLVNTANCVGYGGSLNGWAVHKELLNECRYALEAKDKEIAKYKALCDQMGAEMKAAIPSLEIHFDSYFEALAAWRESK